MLSRLFILFLAVSLLAFSGCQGRLCQRFCGGCSTGGCSPGLGINPLGSPTIAPPATGNFLPTTDPYYGSSVTPANGTGINTGTGIPAQPASSTGSPGWRSSNQTLNPTSFNVPITASIPLNNVVSSTQTSNIRPATNLAEVPATNVGLNQANRTATNQPVNLGMPVNDATITTTPNRFANNGNFNQLQPPNTRNVPGTIQYIAGTTRSGNPNYNQQPYNLPYNQPYNQGVLANSSTQTGYYYGPNNSGWQQRNNNQLNR